MFKKMVLAFSLLLCAHGLVFCSQQDRQFESGTAIPAGEQKRIEERMKIIDELTDANGDSDTILRCQKRLKRLEFGVYNPDMWQKHSDIKSTYRALCQEFENTSIFSFKKMKDIKRRITELKASVTPEELKAIAKMYPNFETRIFLGCDALASHAFSKLGTGIAAVATGITVTIAAVGYAAYKKWFAKKEKLRNNCE